MLRDSLGQRVVLDRVPPGDLEVHLGCPQAEESAAALCGWRPGPDRDRVPLATAPTCAVCADLANAPCSRCGETHQLRFGR